MTPPEETARDIVEHVAIENAKAEIPYIAPSPEVVAAIKRYEENLRQIQEAYLDAYLVGVSYLKEGVDGSLTRVDPRDVFNAAVYDLPSHPAKNPTGEVET